MQCWNRGALRRRTIDIIKVIIVIKDVAKPHWIHRCLSIQGKPLVSGTISIIQDRMFVQEIYGPPWHYKRDLWPSMFSLCFLRFPSRTLSIKPQNTSLKLTDNTSPESGRHICLFLYMTRTQITHINVWPPMAQSKRFMAMNIFTLL